MAEEQQGQEKTEEPTPRKLEKARREGQVARSRELNSVATVSFGALALAASFPYILEVLSASMTYFFREAAHPTQSLQMYLLHATTQGSLTVLPLGIVLFVSGVLSSIALGGLVFAPKALAFKAERLSPLKGFKRMFSMKSLVELGKSLAKFVLIAGVAIAVLAAFLDQIFALNTLPVEIALLQGLNYVGIAFVLVGASLLVVAAIDVPFQISQFRKQMRMTKQEVKDELKDMEGKPEVKARIRSLQQQVSQRKMLEAVPTADVVITNPEHFAVAIKYAPGTMDAPILVAKGADFMAMRIREVASANDVPLVPAPPLARAIFYSTEVEREIPQPLYLAVAQVLAYVYQLNNYRRGQLEQRPTLGAIDIPADFATGESSE